MSTIAIIPARAGSKRIPKKNLALVNGIPMVTWSIRAAVESEMFDRIIVSSDSSEIYEIAKVEKVEFDQRPPELAGDDARVRDVCIDILSRIEAQGEMPKIMSVLYATAPLRTAEDIKATVSLITPGICDFAVAVTEFSHPVHQALIRKPDGSGVPAFPELVRLRHDEIASYVVDNGSTYSVCVEEWLRQKTWFGSSLRMHLMPRRRSIDVDTPEDLDYLRFVAGQDSVS